MLTVLLLFSFFISGILEEYVVKNESEDELEGLAALFFEHERKPAVRIRGYVEEVVANLSDDRFKRVQFFVFLVCKERRASSD